MLVFKKEKLISSSVMKKLTLLNKLSLGVLWLISELKHRISCTWVINKNKALL